MVQMINTKMVSRVVLFFLFCAWGFSEGIVPELNQEDYENLLKNRLIVRYKDVKGGSWPEVTIFKLIKATPRECAAVFSYYPDQTNYSPDLMESRPIKYITPSDVHVLFRFDMPWPASNTVSVTGNRLSRLPNNSYQIEWYFVKSDSVHNNHGTAQFFPYGDFTVYRYRNYIEPKSSLAKLFKNKMIKNLKKSCLAFESYITYLKNNHPELLKKYLTIMEDVFKGKLVFDITNQ